MNSKTHQNKAKKQKFKNIEISKNFWSPRCGPFKRLMAPSHVGKKFEVVGQGFDRFFSAVKKPKGRTFMNSGGNVPRLALHLNE